MRDVARAAGVSVATVSRVLAGIDGVRPAKRARVEAAAGQLGYRLDPIARALAGGGGDEIGLVMAASPLQVRDDPHFARVIAAAATETAARGLSLSVHLVQPGAVVEAPPFAGDRRYVGLLAVNIPARDAALLPARGRPPIVSLGASLPSIPFVSPDNAGGAVVAVRHLVERGRRRVATIAGPSWSPCSSERLAGYRSAVTAAGLASIVVPADFTAEGGASATRRLLASAALPDALFVASDLMAAAALRTLTAAGLRVPDDVAVVGFDDATPALLSTPSLSTIRQPVEEVVAVAVATLFEGATAPHEQRLPTRLVVRASSAA